VSTSLDVAPWQLEAAADDVEDSRSAACWTVEERGWKQVLPDLPDEVIALLATPVVVSAEMLRARDTAGDPARDAGGDPARDAAGTAARAPEPVPARRVEPADRTARFLAPAPPRRTLTGLGRRAELRGPDWSLGRHRRPAAVVR
jgi:hypothetical protein